MKKVSPTFFRRCQQEPGACCIALLLPTQNCSSGHAYNLIVKESGLFEICVCCVVLSSTDLSVDDSVMDGGV